MLLSKHSKCSQPIVTFEGNSRGFGEEVNMIIYFKGARDMFGINLRE